MAETIKVLITDDHPVVRKGLSALLAAKVADIVVVGEAVNGSEAIARAKELNPDVILMDLMMPEVDGVEAIKQIKEDNPDAKILVVTSFATDEMVFPAIKSGALGLSANNDFSFKTNLAVSSIEYCGCLFDERDIWIRLSGGCGHGTMIPLLEINLSR